MQWLQDPNPNTVNNLNNARPEVNRHFRNNKKESLRAKSYELETKSMIKKNTRDLHRGNNDFKRGYQPRTNIVKDEKGDMVTDCLSIEARWRNHFSYLLNLREVNDVKQAELHTKEPLVPQTSTTGG